MNELVNHDKNGVYSKFFDAITEVKARWENDDLRKAVEERLGGDIPEVFQQGPKATIVRYIASPNVESYYFHDLAELSGLDPLYLEFTQDKFVAKNPSKYHLCKLSSVSEENSGEKSVKVVDFNKYEGKLLSEIETLNGKRLVQFHHDLFTKSSAGIQKPFIYDFSEWFLKHRNKNGFYYFDYLALFVCHGVLFENFLGDKEESNFTDEIVKPAFEEIERVFGVKPLIFPLQPIKVEEHKNWYGYKDALLEEIREEITK